MIINKHLDISVYNQLFDLFRRNHWHDFNFVTASIEWSYPGEQYEYWLIIIGLLGINLQIDISPRGVTPPACDDPVPR